MRNNQSSNRAGAGASGRRGPSGAGAGRSAGPGRGSRSDARPFARKSTSDKPFDGERKPFDRERKPFDRERKPFDRERKPFDRERKPFDGERKPFDRDRKPFDRDRKPFDRDRKPYGDRPSFDRERKPFDGERKPFDRDRKPFDRDRKPFDRDRKPYGDRPSFDRERKPFDGERKPFDRDRKPFDRDRKPFDRDRKPFDRERPSFDRERRPYGDRPSFNRERPSFDGPRRVVKKTPSAPKRDDGLVRLNKFIANSGICSRREADEYITAGLVSVNGTIISELGVRVSPNDDIRFNGERLKGEEKVYIVMNKPKDFVTTLSDPNAEQTVMDLIAGKCTQRVYPVGRLDKQTTGVLLLTNDGELADKLTHPSNNRKKIYHIVLDKNLSKPDFDAILKGIELEDGLIFADSLSYVDEDNAQVGLEIHSGRNRIVRRIFEHLGYKVKRLDRVYFAGLTKKNLRRGQWRFLTDQEATMLKMGSYE
ncbi:MAG: pseudouridine synthase [Bacteroidetes bacterium HGW-Bacteroidetes-14]|jgi:23S rRNA pseudouridine2605 synthase|nr:MAG: pseudouridine synthase [Bacteroidetes bacterium HGW-Bacteroidetes-14]